VISGLPADSFVYLGHLPQLPDRRRALLASLSAETRTLVALALPEDLAGLGAEVHAALGRRQVVLVGATEAGTAVVWRGILIPEPGWHPAESGNGLHVLVVAGAEEATTLWDEARLRAAVRAGLARGLGAKGVSRALADESGWPRRAIYDLAVELAKEPPPKP
jgi:16S rRNA (cytidine1402-2'-O)-methyltransferase